MDIPAFEDLFAQIKIIMWMFGIPFKGSKIEPRFFVFIFSISITIAGEYAFMASRFGPENFLELTQLIPCAFVGLLSVLKILPIAANRKKMFDLIYSLERLYDSILQNPKKMNVVKKEIGLLKTLIKYFILLNTVLITVYNFSSLVFMLYTYVKTNVVKFRLPYPVVLPWGYDTWPSWFVMYIHSVISGFLAIMFVTTVDALYSVLTAQICTNFSIISHEMHHLDKSNTNILKDLVKDHQNLLKLSEDLEAIFRLPNLFNYLVGSLEICALGFNLTLGNWTQIPGCILFLISVLFQILMMSIFGEKLIDESRKVGDAVFGCEWYDMDEKSKKTILIILTRSIKFQKLTAYKFSVISYASFTRIISTSWSYFTILRTVFTPPESLQL